MNQITLLGRLTRDPEVRYTPNGKVVAQFALAVDRPYKNAEGQREADFIPIVVWGNSAETAGKSGKQKRNRNSPLCSANAFKYCNFPAAFHHKHNNRGTDIHSGNKNNKKHYKYKKNFC